MYSISVKFCQLCNLFYKLIIQFINIYESFPVNKWINLHLYQPHCLNTSLMFKGLQGLQQTSLHKVIIL